MYDKIFEQKKNMGSDLKFLLIAAVKKEKRKKKLMRNRTREHNRKYLLTWAIINPIAPYFPSQMIKPCNPLWWFSKYQLFCVDVTGWTTKRVNSYSMTFANALTVLKGRSILLVLLFSFSYLIGCLDVYLGKVAIALIWWISNMIKYY